jgi:putative copper export protein
MPTAPWTDDPAGASAGPTRPRAVPPPVPPVPRVGVGRRLATTGGRLVGAAVALGIAWLVLVALRSRGPAATSGALSARLDAGIERTLLADHVLSIAAWAGYVSTTLVLGGLVFQRFVSRPGRGTAGRVRVPPRRRSTDTERVLRAAIALGLIAVTVSLPLRGAVVSGRGLAGLGASGPLLFALTSPFGDAAVVRAAGLGLVAASRAGGPLRGVAGTVGAAVLLGSYLLVGHPQANHPAAVEVAAQAVHVTAVSVWFGGVVYLAAELRQRRREGSGRVSARVVSRFSRLAELMVVLVLCSGTILTVGQVRLKTPFWTTPYGRALVAKLAFVAVVLVVGGYNRQRVVPAVAERNDAAAWRHLRVTCVAEALVMALGILLMTAAMTSGGI